MRAVSVSRRSRHQARPADLMVNAQADALTVNESWEMSMVDISLSRVRAFNVGVQHLPPLYNLEELAELD